MVKRSLYYVYPLDRAITGEEHLRILGICGLKTHMCTDYQLKDLGGEAMAAPSIAVLVLSVLEQLT